MTNIYIWYSHTEKINTKARSHNSRSLVTIAEVIIAGLLPMAAGRGPWGATTEMGLGHHLNGKEKSCFANTLRMAYANLSANEPIGSLFVKSHLLYLLILLNPNSIVLK